MEEIRVSPNENYIHLYSGGLDSTYALLKLSFWIEKNKGGKAIVHPVFIDYGQFAAQHEWSCVNRTTDFIRSKLKDYQTIANPVRICLRSDLFSWCKNVAFTGVEVGDETPEIHNRNIILLSVLASYLRACAENQGIGQATFVINTGFIDGEMRDCNRKFFGTLQTLLTEEVGNYPIRIHMMKPASRKQTTEQLKRLLKGSQKELNHILSMITSCYSPRPNGAPCKKCLKCRRIAASK